MDNSSNIPSAINRVDYKTPKFTIPFVELVFDLDAHATRVRSTLTVAREGNHNEPLVLDGDCLSTISVSIDGKLLAEDSYEITEKTLTLNVPDQCTVETICVVDPDANTTLNGLYRSSNIYCTQCEPEGFRRITWFPDRPDVLSVYTVTINADQLSCPKLLSNGNRINYQQHDNNTHSATWNDPWPKPSYLFALVAGDLGCLQDNFTTCSGRNVSLEIYAEHHNMDQCDHAMSSLKHSMEWDEAVYGREYDLDIFMIVAVDDFNMGAMENKGLNVFNSKYVLARQATATDSDFEHIEGVIGHEYFHNWSGNRVTCRDWFQLSLKEGFTVFRDQEFSADRGSRSVKRISDVNVLRSHQFPEDNGPMAHSVRPDSYVEINNFYTVTIYEKGAEVVRMLYNLLGAEQFRKGCDLYFERHDGAAVTTDDFVIAHEDASGRNLQQFRLWYSQAGTPRVRIETDYDESNQHLTISMHQHIPDTPDQSDKKPMHIPVKAALFSTSGEVVLSKNNQNSSVHHEHLFELTEKTQKFELFDVKQPVVASYLRGFSAPVKLSTDHAEDQLAVLLSADNDDFNRWDAGQKLAMNAIMLAIDTLESGDEPTFQEHYLHAYEKLLNSDVEDLHFHAQALQLPGYTLIAEECEKINPARIFVARNSLENHLATRLKDDFIERYHSLKVDQPYEFTVAQSGRRALRNCLLGFIMAADNQLGDELCTRQFRESDNMTDRMAALSILCEWNTEHTKDALDNFYNEWNHQPLIVDKWLSVQARSTRLATIERMHTLLTHPAYNDENPNKVRSLIGVFSHGNPIGFHDISGEGYEFVHNQIIALDKINPQIAARLAGAFNHWRRYAEPWSSIMKDSLIEIQKVHSLSRDVSEIVNRALG